MFPDYTSGKINGKKKKKTMLNLCRHMNKISIYKTIQIKDTSMFKLSLCFVIACGPLEWK